MLMIYEIKKVKYIFSIFDYFCFWIFTIDGKIPEMKQIKEPNMKIKFAHPYYELYNL